jgi:hypothetical protein
MPTNQFLPFATNPGAFVMSNAAWTALAARLSGYPTGLLTKEALNTALRQACFVGAAVSQAVADASGLDTLDDGVIANWTNALRVGIRNLTAAGFRLDTGAVDAFVVAFDPVLTAYVNGLTIKFIATNTNTGACTLNAGPGAISLRREDGQPLQAGDIAAGTVVTATYDAVSGRAYITGKVYSQFGALARLNLGFGLINDGMGNAAVSLPPSTANLLYVNASTALVPGQYMVDTTAGDVTITLQAAPAVGTMYRFVDIAGTWGLNPMTLDRNAQTIMGFAENLTCETGAEDLIIWFHPDLDWRLQ